MRVVLDTNVFIAALLVPNGVAGELLRLWRKQKYSLLYNTEQILELKEVLARPAFTKRIKRHRVGSLVRSIRLHGQQILNNQNSINSSDPKDDFLIAIAEHGTANYLVSRDQLGILILDLGQCKTITPEEFLSILKTQL